MTITNNAFSKKRRLLEAFIEVEESPQMRNISLPAAKKINLSTSNEPEDCTLKMDCSTDTSELEKYQPMPKYRLSARVLNLFEIKLQIFEQWEAKKRRALQKIYESVDALTNKEEKLEKLRSIQKEKEVKRKQLQNVNATMATDLSVKAKTRHSLPKCMQQPKPPQKQLATSTVKEQITKIEKMVPIGPNGTVVPEKVLQLINWNQPTAATRKLLMTIFDRDTLAFHTLTGKPSPAFMGCGRPLKDQLNPHKVLDIIHIVTKKSKAPERDVRSAITTKCADENKMYKQRQQRKNKLATLMDTNKENLGYRDINNTTF